MSTPESAYPGRAALQAAIDRVGMAVDADLAAHGAKLTHGCEPTFVSSTSREAAEWNHAALGPEKRAAGETLLSRLHGRWAPQGLMLVGQGKHYPGELLPRWALVLFWRVDGHAVWRNAQLNALSGEPATANAEHAARFAGMLASQLGLDGDRVITAYEDPWHVVNEESRLPVDVDPHATDLTQGAERARLARLLRQGLATPAGYVLPLSVHSNSGYSPRWRTRSWPLRRERLYLIPGHSALGYRLPLDTLPADKVQAQDYGSTAVCVELRDGRLHVFLPPLAILDQYVDLVAAVERTSEACRIPVVLEGFEPPADGRVQVLRITPDPGVLEINLHPAASWLELSVRLEQLYEEASKTGLIAEKYLFDGRRVGTGGGCHITLGGPTPAQSPFLRRPDLLRSLITYWQNHPALSYLFAGLFIGPTSQAPRVDEARDDALYELDIAFQQLARAADNPGAAHSVDALLKHLLVDVTGNAHRSEFCIDKLDSASHRGGRQGLLELRAFEMAPNAHMSLVQALTVRALTAMFWRHPYQRTLVQWGRTLHDRFMLPHFLALDLEEVVADLRRASYAFESSWFQPFIDFRCPFVGHFESDGIRVELRHALEPWLVLGDAGGGATSRPVDSSLERLEVRVTGMDPARHAIVCNGRRVPLTRSGAAGTFVAGVRFRAWHFEGILHPSIEPHAPLTFDMIQLATGCSMAACTYHVMDPAGTPYDRRPASAAEAAARRAVRFALCGHANRRIEFVDEPVNPLFPLTLDLRYGHR